MIGKYEWWKPHFTVMRVIFLIVIFVSAWFSYPSVKAIFSAMDNIFSRNIGIIYWVVVVLIALSLLYFED